tara:strand:- start:537 stop:776 length:240 start_codon:yes stop_codon:yes gene_type:complete
MWVSINVGDLDPETIQVYGTRQAAYEDLCMHRFYTLPSGVLDEEGETAPGVDWEEVWRDNATDRDRENYMVVERQIWTS